MVNVEKQKRRAELAKQGAIEEAASKAAADYFDVCDDRISLLDDRIESLEFQMKSLRRLMMDIIEGR